MRSCRGAADAENRKGTTMGRVASRVGNTINFLARHGLRRFVQESDYRLYNAFQEARLGVKTSFCVSSAAAGIDDLDAVDYVPMGYRALRAAIERLPLHHECATFLDYGAGKGRAVVTAATYPFSRVIGVELSSSLVEIAEQNVRRMKHRRAQRVDIVQADAGEYVVPDDVNVIYFFNPFRGKVLRQVVSNIRASFAGSPRVMHIVFFNEDHFESIVQQEAWLVKTECRQVYPGYTCGVYRASPP